MQASSLQRHLVEDIFANLLRSSYLFPLISACALLTQGGPLQQERQEPSPTGVPRGGAGWGEAGEACHTYGGGSQRGGEVGRPRHLYGKPRPLLVPSQPFSATHTLCSAPGWILKSHCLKSDTFQNLGRAIGNHMHEATSGFRKHVLRWCVARRRLAPPRWNLSGWLSGEWPFLGSGGFSGSDGCISLNFCKDPICAVELGKSWGPKLGLDVGLIWIEGLLLRSQNIIDIIDLFGKIFSVQSKTVKFTGHFKNNLNS